MGKRQRKIGTVKEKIADLLIDVAKYIFTAVVVASAFKEFDENSWGVYFFGVLIALGLVLFSIMILNMM